MRVIITGATGFIGTALCYEMLNAGHEITAVIRPGSKKNKIFQSVNVMELSLDRLNELSGSYDLFYHLAWNGSSGEARNDFEIQQMNIKYTIEAIRAAQRCGCQKFIGAGSQAEYGIVNGICTEETLPRPFMMYGAAKLSTYHIGKIVAEQVGISFVWPRIYSVYGPGQNKGTLISYLIDTLCKGEIPQLSACDNMWDFMYIDDCCAALRLLGETSRANDVYNVSAGTPQILKQFVKEVRNVISPEIFLQFAAVNRLNRVFWLEPDVTKLKKLGYETKVNFKEGIIFTYNAR